MLERVIVSHTVVVGVGCATTGGTAEKGRVTAAVVMTWSARALTAMGDEGSALRILTQIIQVHVLCLPAV